MRGRGRNCRGSINDTSTVVILAVTISMKRKNSGGGGEIGIANISRGGASISCEWFRITTIYDIRVDQ